MSEQDNEWSLKHRDNVEHGPFELADLISAAKTGNIATDTMLRHPKHTRNQWIIATRVTAIAQALTPTPPTSIPSQPTPPRVNTPSSDPNHSVGETASNHPSPTSATTADNSAPASKSFFRRVHPRASGNAGEQRQMVASQTNQHSDQTNQPTEPTTATQGPPIRNWQDDQLLVPRTLPDAFFALFDFKFRFFITPWIVKILWFTGFTIALLMVLKLGYDDLIRPNTTAQVSAGQDTTSWTFEPLDGKPFLSFPAVRYLLIAMGIFCSVLILRVACEAFIVMFRIAGSLTEVKAIISEKK